MLVSILPNPAQSNDLREYTMEFLNDRHFVYNETFTNACKKFVKPNCIVVDESKLGDPDPEKSISLSMKAASTSPWKVNVWTIARWVVKGCEVGQIKIVRKIHTPNNSTHWSVVCADDVHAPTLRVCDLIGINSLRERIREVSELRRDLQVLQFLLVGGMPPDGSVIVTDSKFKKGK